MRKSTILALAGSLWMMGAALAGTLGQVVPIGGAAADVALDEARGRLYIADFTAKRVDVMTLATKTIQTSINLPAQPSSLSVSPDGHWLAVSHFGNKAVPNSSTNGISLIDLRNGNARQTFTLSNPPLGVAFGINNKALIVTTGEFILFDPAFGTTQLIGTIQGEVAKTLPQPPQTFPPQITQASVGASADGYFIWGFGDQLRFRYDVLNQSLITTIYSASPNLGPRVVAVSNDGAQAAMGWWLSDINPLYQYPRIYATWAQPSGDLARGGHAIDSTRNVIYSEVPQSLSDPPVLLVQDLDNLTVRERLQMPEHIAGRSVMSSDGATMYSSSDSGVMILPVGNLTSAPRLQASVEDLVFRGNYCDRSSASQSFILSDPGGASVPFTITSSNAGVRVSPSSGKTPAVIQVTVDANAFSGQKGTVAVSLTFTSTAAVNIPVPVRVLVNSREPSQRGTFIDVPGTLSDVVADPVRDQYYVLRQDKNQLLVFDGSNNTVKATLRTCNVPLNMTVTYDDSFLLVSCAEAQIMTVVDLEILQVQTPVHTRNSRTLSVASSSNRILTVAINEVDSSYSIHEVSLASLTDFALPDLGVWTNTVPQNTVATASPNGSTILFASSDGSILLYDANVDGFTLSRKDFNSFAGAYAASSYGQYVIGNHVFNASMVPTGLIQPTTGTSSGFAFVDQGGFFVTASDATSPGVIERVPDLTTGLGTFPTSMVEAPLLTTATVPFTRTVAPLFSRNNVIALTVSGVTVLPNGYDASVAVPNIQAVVSAADGVAPPAPGGLFSIYGTNLSPTNVATQELPLPTALGDSCMTINGQPVPILFVSPTQVNAQMPSQAIGNVTMVVHTPGGVSDNYNLTVPPTAPSLFYVPVTGNSYFPTIVRYANGLVVTDTNPVHRNDILIIYLTGMGRVSPSVPDGQLAPLEPPFSTTVSSPQLSVGGVPMSVLWSGLTPGQIGLYQLNVAVPGTAPKGLSVPLTITQQGATDTINIRVVQ